MLHLKAGLAGLALAAILTSASPATADDKAGKLTALVEQGWSLIAQNKNEEAIAPLEQALAITGDPAPPSPETAYVMKALGTAYGNAGKFEQAETYDRRAVDIEAVVFGPDDLKSMEGVANLGILYARQGKMDKATPYLEKALSIAEAKLPANSPQTAYCLTMVGQIYMRTGKTSEGKGLLARAAAINGQHP